MQIFTFFVRSRPESPLRVEQHDPGPRHFREPFRHFGLRPSSLIMANYRYVTVLVAVFKCKQLQLFGVDGTAARTVMHIPSAPRMKAVLPPSTDAVSTLTLPTAARAFSLGFSLELFPATPARGSCFLAETDALRDHLRRRAAIPSEALSCGIMVSWDS